MLVTITLKIKSEPSGHVFGTICYVLGNDVSYYVDLALAPWEWIAMVYAMRGTDMMLVNEWLLTQLPETINPELMNA